VRCSRGGSEVHAFLYAFDLLGLNGTDLRREPIEVRKATLAGILRKARHGVRLNEHLAQIQNLNAPAVRREAEEDWGRPASRVCEERGPGIRIHHPQPVIGSYQQQPGPPPRLCRCRSRPNYPGGARLRPP
jgi:hypothetical protein